MARNRRQSLQCKWACCPQQGQVFSSPDELSLHVVDSHVNPCSKHDLFICHWEGCKVYNRPSYSFGWLQRHVKQKHTKERPNKCLMNGCNMSFNSVDALQKHMLRHFDTHTISPSSSPKKATTTAAAAAAARETPDALSSKVSVIEIQKVSSALCTSSSSVQGSEVEGMDDQVLQVKDPLPTLLYMKQQHSMKVKIPRKTLYSSCPYTKLPVAFNGAHFHSEVMDRKTMSVIRHTANSLARQDISSLSSPSITLTAKIIGERKQDLESEQEVLVRWTPRVVPDEWMYVHHYCCSKVVNFSDLPSSQLSLLASKCYSFNKFQGRKSKRKP